MSLLWDKLKEVGQTLLPVVVLVIVLNFTFVDVTADVFVRFLIGAAAVLVGLAVFLLGIDFSMEPIGGYMAEELARSKSWLFIAFFAFLLGFLITVAEPDLLILGHQIEAASGATLSAQLIVYMVSLGVGGMISLGIIRSLRRFQLNAFMAGVYFVILILAFFVSEEFLAISFDASGATTGALTTPFVLAISSNLAQFKGGDQAEENAFGLVGTMSTGPILAVMLMAILTGQSEIQGAPEAFEPASGYLQPFIHELGSVFVESFLALLPISLLFFAFNFFKFKLDRKTLLGIVTGLVITLLGLALFLAGVNSGFMDMGRIIGMQFAEMGPWPLIILGIILGMIVVLVEPAVHVLARQIEEVSGGSIPPKLIAATLSIGVATAIALAMVRILVPEVKLWYFLLPGFLVAILLSFVADKIFVGIAYDAGGVASGPMTATFILAFAQGAADVWPTADQVVDGFGVIAMVAMAPVFSLMVLGTLYRLRRTEKAPSQPSQALSETSRAYVASHSHSLVLAVAMRGYSQAILDTARGEGATGATILHGRGQFDNQRITLPFINIEIQPEQEVILFVTPSDQVAPIANALTGDESLREEARLEIFITPTRVQEEVFYSQDDGDA